MPSIHEKDVAILELNGRESRLKSPISEENRIFKNKKRPHHLSNKIFKKFFSSCYSIIPPQLTRAPAAPLG